MKNKKMSAASNPKTQDTRSSASQVKKGASANSQTTLGKKSADQSISRPAGKNASKAY